MRAKILFALILGAIAVTGTSAADTAASRLAAGGVDREQLQFNMESVSKLLTVSSAARQIDSSRAPEALSRRDKALETLRAAQAALASGDLQQANALLIEVRATFFDAVRLAAPEELIAKKQESDYRARLDSVKALLAAYQRIAGEKKDQARGVPETIALIERSMAEAAMLAAAGRHRDGRAELDRAYLVAKSAISGLRSGDTLVRSLNFASKEEEFHYEVDRNNTHQMLIKVLLEDKKAAEGGIQGFLAKANELRAAADAAATQGRYPDAIRLLEDSTAELVRAIRNAGVYIPG